MTSSNDDNTAAKIIDSKPFLRHQPIQHRRHEKQAVLSG